MQKKKKKKNSDLRKSHVSENTEIHIYTEKSHPCSKAASKSLIDWNPVSSRLISVRLIGQSYSITITQAYALLVTTNHSDDAVDNFYKMLQHTIDNMPRRDIKILMGDFNA